MGEFAKHLKTDREVRELFDRMFYEPENFVEREVFVAAYEHSGSGDGVYKKWVVDGRKPEALPIEVVSFCRTRLEKKNE